MAIELKEVLLEQEKNNIKLFLNNYDLKYSDDIDKTYYLEDNNKIIGTISVSNYIIKCLAVDEAYRGENLAGMLINQVLTYFRENNIYSYQVFTKPIYEQVFLSMGFRLLTKTSKVLMLEGGVDNILDEVNKIKRQIEISQACTLDETIDIGAIVLNANPITNGHVYLIEQASKNHTLLLVFVVEEDKSMFSFKERFSLVYLACKRLSNVIVLPSTKYMVSSLTFPDYFLKNETEKVEENAYNDALIFKNYFMKNLFIKKRYVGSETKNKMVIYNNSLKEVLGDALVIIPRLQQDNQDVSASVVRDLINNNQIQQACELIPRECYMVFMTMCMMKNGK